MKKNLLFIKGGGGTEHDISLISAKYVIDNIDTDIFDIHEVTINKDGRWRCNDGKEVELDFRRELVFKSGTRQAVDIAVPCIHGPPGETGEIQSFFELIKLPYLGCGPEASITCFNKITTKLWLEYLGIATTPFVTVTEKSEEQIVKAEAFFDEHQYLFVKASNQGSSVGCYPVKKREMVAKAIQDALDLSPFVVVEKALTNIRELEISTFEYQGKVYATVPGEIICPDKFYSFEEKYDAKSHTQTATVASGLTTQQVELIQEIGRKAFAQLGLRDLARMDFFLCDDGTIYVNEINTFPGMTPISMFPKMMEHHGIKFKDFLTDRFSTILK